MTHSSFVKCLIKLRFIRWLGSLLISLFSRKSRDVSGLDETVLVGSFAVHSVFFFSTTIGEKFGRFLSVVKKYGPWECYSKWFSYNLLIMRFQETHIFDIIDEILCYGSAPVLKNLGFSFNHSLKWVLLHSIEWMNCFKTNFIGGKDVRVIANFDVSLSIEKYLWNFIKIVFQDPGVHKRKSVCIFII